MSVDMVAVARLCRRTLTPDTRPVCWKLMLGYLPADRTLWAATEATALARYVDMVRAVCVFDADDVTPRGVPQTDTTTTTTTTTDGGVVVGGDSETLVAAVPRQPSMWPSRRQQLRVIDMDVARTMTETRFFSTPADASPSRSAEEEEQQQQRQHADGDDACERAAELHACTAAVLRCDADTHDFTRAQQALWRLLYTFACVNKGIGYVQGMNELAAHLLYAFAGGDACALTPHVEAAAFFCLQTLFAYLGDHYCRALDYDADTGITSTLRHHERVLAFIDPDLAMHLTRLGIAPAHYALRWLTLLFTHEFDADASLRVWDVLLSCGEEIRNAALLMAAALCHAQRDALLALSSLDEALPVLLGSAPHQRTHSGSEHNDTTDTGCDGGGAHDGGDDDDAAAYARVREHSMLRLVRRWLVLLDMRLIDSLRTATLEHVADMRRSYLVRTTTHAGARTHDADTTPSVV